MTSVLEENVGLDRNLSLILGGCINTMFVIGSLVPAFFLDRLGRRRPMMWGSLGLAISMVMIAILLSFSSSSVGKQTSAASVTFFFTYMLIFGASVNCIPWVYVPEILPLHVRAKGSAIGTSANALWNFFVVMRQYNTEPIRDFADIPHSHPRHHISIAMAMATRLHGVEPPFHTSSLLLLP